MVDDISKFTYNKSIPIDNNNIININPMILTATNPIYHQSSSSSPPTTTSINSTIHSQHQQQQLSLFHNSSGSSSFVPLSGLNSLFLPVQGTESNKYPTSSSSFVGTFQSQNTQSMFPTNRVFINNHMVLNQPYQGYPPHPHPSATIYTPAIGVVMPQHHFHHHHPYPTLATFHSNSYNSSSSSSPAIPSYVQDGSRQASADHRSLQTNQLHDNDQRQNQTMESTNTFLKTADIANSSKGTEKSAYANNEELSIHQSSPGSLMISSKLIQVSGKRKRKDRVSETIINEDNDSEGDADEQSTGNSPMAEADSDSEVKTSMTKTKKRDVFKIPKNRNRNPWKLQEDMLLLELHQRYGNKWKKIAIGLGGHRSLQDVQVRHRSLLRARRREWTLEEDKMILELKDKLGNNWKDMVPYFKGRTKHAIKIRARTISKAGLSVASPSDPTVDPESVENGEANQVFRYMRLKKDAKNYEDNEDSEDEETE